MASESDDEDLRRAIALSLQHHDGGSADFAIDLDSKGLTAKVEEGSRGAEQTSTTKAALGQGTLSSLNRKQMEAERLARLKRKRGDSLSLPVQAVTKQARVAPGLNGNSLFPVPLRSETTASPRPNQSEGIKGGLKFPDGTVKKTAVRGYAKTADDLTLEEVLESETLQLAVFSSFQWDIPWLFKKMNTSKSLVTLIMQAKDEETKLQYREETANNPRLRLCFPPMDAGMGCMHSKLMLLSHSQYLRIVIPTANLVSYDWGETGDMENMLFLIDLPRKVDAQTKPTPSGNKETQFFRELSYFLRSMNLEASIVDSLSKFDFSATSPFGFVHTIGGSHSGSDDRWQRTGHFGLAQAARELSLITKREDEAIEPSVKIDYITSSLGALKPEFLDTLYQSCQGQDTSSLESSSKSSKTKPKASSLSTSSTVATTTASLDENFRIYFPTSHTVTTSHAGSAGTICLASKYFQSATFPRHLLRSCISVRPRVLMHNKLIIVRPVESSSETVSSEQERIHLQPYAQKESKGWAYIGSANCTESAWGNTKLTKDRKTKMHKLYCRNWECGVIVPATFIFTPPPLSTANSNSNPNPVNHTDIRLGDSNSNSSGTSAENQTDTQSKNTKRLRVPIPAVYPGPKYAPGEEPWFHEG